jgi:ribosome-binding factor A
MSRQDKVAEAIRQEISIIIHDELKDPRIGFVTITKVELTHDLSYAKVFFSVLGGEEDYRKTKDALNSALGFVRKLVAERINLRLAPEIAFAEDKNIEYSVHIQKLLDEIRGQDEPKKGSRVHKKKQ